MPAEQSAKRPGEFPPVVLLLGTEATLRDAARRELRAQVLGAGSADFNEARFDLASSGASGAQVLAAARTLPMLGPGRLVVVRGVEDRRAKEFLARDLPSYLEAPVATTCLLLEAEKADRRQRWVKSIQQRGQIRNCNPPSRPGEVRDWISERLRSLGKRPGAGVAAALFEAVGPDLDRLAFEIEKLALYTADAKTVEVEQVTALTGQVRSLAIYELSDAVGTRDIGTALRTLHRLVDQGDAPLAILGALSQHFRRLARASECTPLRAQVVQKQLGIHPYAAEKLVKQLSRFDLQRLVRCLGAMAATDAAIKGASPLSPRGSLEQLLVAVCS